MSKRLSMRKIREILRLRFELGRTVSEIATGVCAGRSTVGDCLAKAKSAGLTWPLPAKYADYTDEQLEALLYPSSQNASSAITKRIDFAHIHQELKRKGMTKHLLWMEYKEQNVEIVGYTRFCDLYRQWSQTVDLPMRQVHKLGERLFIDYAGMTIPLVIDTKTGETTEAQIFVAVLGASNYTFVEATLSQSLPDWVGSHVRAFKFFGGVPEIIVPDNLKSGVTSPHRYDPDVNPTYQDMAEHYGVAVIPARVRKPKDKAKAEEAVQHVERRILARLRNHRFFSLSELNEVIKPLLDELNRQPFQKLPGARLSQFESLEKPLLKPLPAIPYEFAEWKKATVNIDYHIVLDHHYYSAPFVYVKKQIDIRYTATIVELFHNGKRIASHRRVYHQKGRYTTLKEHMPERHQKHLEWTPDRVLHWARTQGDYVGFLAKKIMESRTHVQQGFRSCLGLIRLGKTYGQERLNSACKRALSINAINYQSIQTILKNNLDQQELTQSIADESVAQLEHDNVRGSDYYH